MREREEQRVVTTSARVALMVTLAQLDCLVQPPPPCIQPRTPICGAFGPLIRDVVSNPCKRIDSSDVRPHGRWEES
jgi:hypothetical protein